MWDVDVEKEHDLVVGGSVLVVGGSVDLSKLTVSSKLGDRILGAGVVEDIR